MLNFNTNIQEVVANQETHKRTHEFTEYSSKKKLFESNILNDTQKQYIEQLKGTFAFNLHKDNRYVIITMFYSRDKRYGFLIVDLETLQCAEGESIKTAKKDVLELVASQEVDESMEDVYNRAQQVLRETDEIFADAEPENTVEETVAPETEETVTKNSKKKSK